MAFVPVVAKARVAREPLVALNQALGQEDMTTSRDILLKNFQRAQAKLKFWTAEREKARSQLERFDQEKKDAQVKDLQGKLKEERRRRKASEDKNNFLEQQVKVLSDCEKTVNELKRKLAEERGLRRDTEAKMRKISQKSEIAKKQNFIDFISDNFE